MRIILPSATIAVVSGASLAFADSTIKSTQVARDVDEAYEASTVRGRSRPFALAGDECNTHNGNDATTDEPDIGVLGCSRRNNQTCVADATSSLGGRCATTATNTAITIASSKKPQFPQMSKPTMPAFKKRRNHKKTLPASRHLQEDEDERQVGKEEEEEDEPFLCPTNCPPAFCVCAEADGDAETCAPELHSVCEQGLILECVPDKYKIFYEDTYCPFAECLAVSDRPYEECSCEYYQDYCTSYYEFVESIDKCAISACCARTEKGTKYVCLPGMAPTYGPTMSPTLSFKPSVSPTITHAPSTSTEPTSTRSPTASPTLTTEPTVSSAPTSNPTGSPSESPTESSSPTHPPTTSPTVSPTASPTVRPTNEPSESPSSSPTDLPSPAPSGSIAPSTSFLPTTSPTISSAPTVSSAPTGSPSKSGVPSFPPSLLPTVTQPPSSSPTTSPPTDNPTVSPTDSPSDVPSGSPSAAPVTGTPTASPVITPEPTDTPTKEPTTPAPTTPAPVPPLPDGGEEVTAPTPESGGELPAQVETASTLSSSRMAVGSTRAVMASLFIGVGGALWLFA